MSSVDPQPVSGQVSYPAIAAPVKKSYRFFQSIFLKALAEMPLGVLRVRLPDGSSSIFGKGGPEQSCAEIRVHHPVFFKKCILFGDVGFGESYVDGDWETDDLFAVISWFILNLEHWPTISGTKRHHLLINLLEFWNRWSHRLRDNSLSGSKKNIEDHYDLSNDFFRLFLDSGMSYSCAYYQSPELTLEEAQTVKNDLLCRKLNLRPSDHLLEIGCGWGSFSIHAAKNYGCKVTAVTISNAQHQHAARRVQEEGLTDRVKIHLKDYRQIGGQFHKIASVEMLEAVGDKYLETYFAKCHQLLKKEGLLGLQVITCPDSRFESFKRGSDWIQKHIFPGSLLPSIARIHQAIRRTGNLHLHDLEDIGRFYIRTIAAWEETFQQKMEQVKALGFDERFIRKWKYYFSYCKAGFQMRNISVVQSIFTRPNNLTLASDPS